MSPVFTISDCCGLPDQDVEQAVGALFFLRVVLVKNQGIDMVHLPPADDEYPHVVKTVLMGPLFDHVKLLDSVFARGGRDR